MPVITHERNEEPVTFEKVWEMIQESGREFDRQMKERSREFDLQMKKQQEEAALQMKETRRLQEETARQMKETDKKFGALNNRFGEVVEYMIAPGLNAKFNELGYSYEKIARNVEIVDRKHGIFAEVDVFLENGDSVMIVETKAKPDTRDVDDHIKRMEKLRAAADIREDTRKYYGAIAGVVISESVKKYTLNKGFYVIEPSGESFTITAPAGPGKPTVW
ncbi:hypothetical protein AGMMS49942_29940 [Spirochaetia bacterium]|nr:hypothetical protein AGMMS49942_29940 [Spirochaetia bacterium]